MQRRGIAVSTALALGLAAGALLGGCGSQTRTVTVAGAPPISGSSAPGATTTATQSTPTTRSPTTTASPGSSPSTARSAPEPAFTQQQAHPESVSSASALVRAHGYTPNSSSEYHGGQTLKVLLGTRTGSGDGYGQQAFFFIGGHYIGTDTKEPSAKVKVVSQSDTSITLAYPLYHRNDPLCCPGGGQATVRFELDNGKLTAVGTIPSASRSAAVSRY